MSYFTGKKKMGIRTIASLLLIAGNLFILLPHAMASSSWEPIGPFGGDQFEVKISPSNKDTLFVLGNFAVHRSTDAGLHWQAIHKSDMAMGHFYSLAFDPLDASHLYLTSTIHGIWESRDEGDSWENHSDGLPTIEGAENLNYPIVSLVFDINGSLFAGLSQPKDLDAPPAWIYRSDDGGRNWLPDNSGILVTAPELSQDISALLSVDQDNQLWAMVYGAGVYTYQSGTWLNRNGDLPPEGLLSTFLQHDPLNSNHILLGTEFNWVYETIDGGQSWSAMHLPEALADLEVLPLVYTISIDPNNNQAIYVEALDAMGSIEQPIFQAKPHYQTSGGGIYQSFNGGMDWMTIPYNFFRMTFDPSETITSYIPPYGEVTRSRVSYITSGGTYSLQKSEDGAISLEVFTDGIIGEALNNIWLHPSPLQQETMLFAASESGLYFRLDDETWSHQVAAQDYLYTWSFEADPQDPNSIFYSTGNPAWSFKSQRGIYHTTLDCFGADCPPGDQILSDTGVWKVITTPLQPETIYAACQEDGIMVSYDRGNNWSTFNDGLTLPQSITDIILDSEGNPLLAAARTSNGDYTADPPQYYWPVDDEEGGVYRFDTESAQWLPIPEITYATLNLVVDPWNPEILFAATVRGVYQSADYGQTWEVVLPDVLIYDLVVDPLKSNYLYAATSFGVLRSTDGGKQWHDLSTGLLQKLIFSLSIDPVTGILYAGTAGNSAFQLVPDANPQALIVIDPENLDSGIVPVGFNKDTHITIVNEGEADLIIDDIVPANPAFILPDFSPPLTITPGSHSFLTVRFSPQILGTVESHITFHSNDPQSPAFNYAVRGEGREAISPIPDVKINDENGPITIPYGDTARITINLDAGEYLGQEADFWLKLELNNSITYWYVNNAGWIKSDSPVLMTNSQIVNIDEPTSLDFAATFSGPCKLYFAVDNNKDGSFDGTWFDSVSFTVEDPISPVPVIKVNGQSEHLTVPENTVVEITIELNAGDYLGQRSEYWIEANTPFGSYCFSGWKWVSLPVPNPAFKGPVLNIQPPLKILIAALPKGEYTFKFNIDNIINDSYDNLWVDTVSVTIE